MFGVASELPQQQESQRKAIIACQVCGQDQTLTDDVFGGGVSAAVRVSPLEDDGSGDVAKESQAADTMYIMECCFSVVCKDCIGVTSNCLTAAGTDKENNETNHDDTTDNNDGSRRTTPTETKALSSRGGKSKICLACLEPISSARGGMQSLSFQKNSVLVNLLSSINEANKQVVAAYQQSQTEQSNRSSIFNFITGSNSASTSLLDNTMCHRCQEREQRYVCESCNSSGENKPMKLCQECNTVIHSLGKAFMAHKVSECVEFNLQNQGSGSPGADLKQQVDSDQLRMLLQKLVKLEDCPKHLQPIEYYLDDDVSEDAPFELSGVTYGCQRCFSSAKPSLQANFTKIDKDNLLNVFQLKQELFKERQKAQTTLGSMLSTYNLDIVQKLPELRALEYQNLSDVIARVIKTLQNKQKEIEEQIENRFQKLTDHVYKEKQRMLTKKEVIERNYNLLEKALDVIPLQILSCEEGLLEAMLMANSELMKVMRGQESKLSQRQSMYLQLQQQQNSDSDAEKFEPPFHLIDPVQQKQRLSQLEQFASKIDATISDLFKQASDQLEKRQDVVVLAQQQPQVTTYPSTSLQPYNPSNNSQSSPHFRPGIIDTLESQSQAAFQTYHTNASNSTGNIQPPQTTGFATSDMPAQLSNSQMQSSEEAIALTSPAIHQAVPPGSADHHKRDKLQSVAKTGMSAFLTKQDQASKSRMDRNNMAKSHLSIGKTGSNNQLDVTPDQTKPAKLQGAEQKTQKGGTSRREQSYNAKAAGELGVRGSSQSAVAAHQAYLVSQSANQRYMNNAVSKSSTGLKSVTNKWDSSTRVVNGKSKQRDTSVNSNGQAQAAQQNQGQSLPRSGSYMNQAVKDRSMNRGSLNVSQNARQGAHSTVGLSERWAANATNKRSSNLNISQDMSGATNGELVNQKDRNGEHSPRLSRNRINMNNQAKQERGVSQVGLDPEKQAIKDNMAQIESNCLLPRVFTHVAQTSTAIQVAWSHPSNFQKIIQAMDENGQTILRKQHIQYVLEYGIGVKVDNKEQFRQIYKGKAHKCIITDLMPRTTFRLRVAPILNMEKSQPIDSKDQQSSLASGSEQAAADAKKMVVTQEQGQWSEVTNITTKETQTFDVGGALSSSNPKAPNLMSAQIQTKGRKKWLNFDKAGTLLAMYGYSFGEHLWCLKIQYQEHQNMPMGGSGQASSALDQSGSMVIGVVNKRFSNQKMFGSVINYSLFKGEIVVKIYLDSNKKRLIIYSPQHPQGDIFSDLPKDGLFFPAVQNKTAVSKQKSSLKVYFKFDQLIPKDKSEIGASLIYSSGDDGADNTNDDLSQNASMHGATMNQSINSSSMQHHQHSNKAEDGKQGGSRRATTKQPTPMSEKQNSSTFTSSHQQHQHQMSQAMIASQQQRTTTSNRFNSASTLSTGGAAQPHSRQHQHQQAISHQNNNIMKESQITQNNNGQAD